jgi:hypothetical protein
VQRKQHIGNDVVVIIFVDGKTPFSPISFTSQFNSTLATTHPPAPIRISADVSIRVWRVRVSCVCRACVRCAEVFVVVQKDDSSEDDVTRYRVAVTASQPVRHAHPSLSMVHGAAHHPLHTTVPTVGAPVRPALAHRNARVREGPRLYRIPLHQTCATATTFEEGPVALRLSFVSAPPPGRAGLS